MHSGYDAVIIYASKYKMFAISHFVSTTVWDQTKWIWINQLHWEYIQTLLYEENACIWLKNPFCGIAHR